MMIQEPSIKSKVLTVPNLILLLYLFASVVKFILGTEVFRERYFVLMFIAIFAPYVIFAPAPYKKHVWFIFAVFFVGSILAFVNWKMHTVLIFGSTMMQLGMACFVLKYRYRISEKIPEYGFYAFLVYILVVFARNGSFEYHFAEASRNTVSWLSIIFCALYYLIIFLQGRSPTNFIPPLLALIISIVAQGRAGIITSFLLLVTAFWYSTRRVKSNYKMWIVSILALIGMSVYVYTHTGFFEERLEYFKVKGFEESSRIAILESYVESLNVRSVITGGSLDETAAGGFNSNPHNSFIMGHVRYGIMAFVFYGMILYSLMKGVINQQTRFLALILFVVLLRMMTDKLVFVYPFDFVIYAMVVALISKLYDDAHYSVEYDHGGYGADQEENVEWQLPCH